MVHGQWRRRRGAASAERGSTSRAWALAGLLAGSGVVHLVRPQTFDPIVPRALPGPARAWTYGSGVAELAVAATLAVPSTRRWGGLAAAGLFVGVFPANVTMARTAFRKDRPTREKLAVLVRLPLQVPLVLAAARVWRRA